ncbi:hypothetical protein TNIN_234271 [Trichonephila inaurata madagascariensis]|uniref:Uncharacterized protein n=1 Tax=Trichonephila inaurata madagascariensis TaxID=2747483 RepID=A0A8X6XTZ2_9ARAC|nr:hypothetical protein TNIN_234271 [Trichonephila inaurata madagascariensis]
MPTREVGEDRWRWDPSPQRSESAVLCTLDCISWMRAPDSAIIYQQFPSISLLMDNDGADENEKYYHSRDYECHSIGHCSYRCLSCITKGMQNVTAALQIIDEDPNDVAPSVYFGKECQKRTFLSREEKRSPGFKAAKNLLTLVLSGNASGDFKLKLFFTRSSVHQLWLQ